MCEVLRWGNLHPVMKMNEHETSKPAMFTKQIGILEYPQVIHGKSLINHILTKFQNYKPNWNLTGICALNIGIPVYWNKFQFIGIGLESWNRRQG